MPPSTQTPPHLNTFRRDQARRRELSAALRQRQPHAIGTWLLLVVNTAIYVAMATDAGGIRSFSSRLLIAWGALFAPEVSNGFDPRADNAAHTGGFVAGFLFGWAGGRRIEWRLPTMRVSAAAAVIAVGCCAVALATQRELTDVRPALLAAFSGFADPVAVLGARQVTRGSRDHQTND